MRKWTWFASAVIAAVALASAASAAGRGGHGGRMDSTRGFGGRHPAGILERLINPCRTACFDTDRECHKAADDVAVGCIASTCSAEVTTAQTACGEDRRSEACKDAIDALRDCGDACLDTRAASLDVCRDAADDCRDACEE